MPRDNINPTQLTKLKNYFRLTLDKNNDGIINWADFEHAIESMVPKEDAEKNARLNIVRKRLEQNFQKYFWDLCEVGDANKDGNIDLDEWLDVMDDIISHLRVNKSFPDWYEALHKLLFRSQEFYDDRALLKEEFVNMMFIWDIEEAAAEKAYDYITENGQKKMDYALFSELLKKFFMNVEPDHPINMGLDTPRE